MQTIICQNCSVPFSVDQSKVGAKYCSLACRYAKAKCRQEKQCPTCATVFSGKRTHCSRPCFLESLKPRWDQFGLCEGCQQRFKRDASHRRFCSIQCRSDAKSREHQARVAGRTEKACAKCGQVKSLSDFTRRSDAADGRAPRCRNCTTEDQREGPPANYRRYPVDPSVTHKTCVHCGQTRSVADFYVSCRNKDGYAKGCTPCQKNVSPEDRARLAAAARAREQVRRDANFDERKRQIRAQGVKHKFGISIDEYERRLQDQNSRCAICGDVLNLSSSAIALDHDHLTRAIRGFLCPSCNKGIGFFRDSPERLLAAYDYLLRYQ